MVLRHYLYFIVGKFIRDIIKLNCSTDMPMRQEVPRLFIEEYGILLIDNVHLLMPDGREYCVHFCGISDVLSGLHKMMQSYSVKEKYVLFFDYVGRSHFFINIYTEDGVDVFDNCIPKVMLTDVMCQTKCPVINLSDNSGDESEGIIVIPKFS